MSVPVKEETAVVPCLARAGWAVAPGEPCRTASPPGIRITTAVLGIDLTPRLADDIAEVLTHRRRIVTVRDPSPAPPRRLGRIAIRAGRRGAAG
nr:hypothetical protein [Acidimicrobiia bacterium]